MTLPSCLIPPPRAQSLTLIAARDLRPGDVIIWNSQCLEIIETEDFGDAVAFDGFINDDRAYRVSPGRVFQRAGRLVPMVRA